MFWVFLCNLQNFPEPAKNCNTHKNERNSSNVREMVQLEDDKFVQEIQISHLKALGCFLI